MKDIIFFGDSLTAGYGLSDPAKQALPALISQKIKQTGLQYRVINAGLSGDTTRSAIIRLNSILNHDIKLFVLELGANDFLRGHSPAEINANLQQIISRVKVRCPEASILILGIALPNWAAGFQGSGYTSIFQQLANENGIAIVPSFLEGIAGNRSMNMPDGVHPLAKGYERAAENIWPSVLSLIS